MTAISPEGGGGLAADGDRGDHPGPVDLLADLDELADEGVALDGRVAQQGLRGLAGDPPGVAEPDRLRGQDAARWGTKTWRESLDLGLGQGPVLGEAQDQGGRPAPG